ncbi:MAG: NAD(P)/FAD-dependent oxidoreductase [Candidatus Omnitrophica bacterium]|nr:NAD(P)/FAD-dependent oxidoreductase [Candidatus Omnitrophota bacterium]
MAAICAGRTAQEKRAPLEILLLETSRKVGAKILMSGGTRCNVTHKEVKPSDFQGGPRHFVKHVLEAFTPADAMGFFNGIGVELVLEPPGKFFPVSHSAQTVLDALIKEVGRAGTALKTDARVTDVKRSGDRFRLSGQGDAFCVSARKVIITTGGLSYPTTGSDGAGYRFASGFGHTIVGTHPALTPLLTNDRDWRNLSGLSLEARLTFSKDGRKQCENRGAFLFTHFGFSGPAALDISRHVATARPEEKPKVVISFLPGHREETLSRAVESEHVKMPKRHIQSVLVRELSLPGRFAETLLKKLGIDGTQTIGASSNETRRRLVHALLEYPLEVEGVYGYKKAEVTAGGVDLREVDVSTMESKLVAGLYFAGEVLDVDGRIGGFNFQWAWSTGALAGRGAARALVS